MPTVHAKDFSASASSRWLGCTGSVIEVRQYENKTSSAAEEGTCAHELAELGLRGEKTYDELSNHIGRTLNDAPTVVVNKEMVDYVWGYIDYCRSFDGDMFVELGELGLRGEKTYEELSNYIGRTLNDAPTVVVNKEMVDYVWGYIDYCRSFDGDMFVEIKVDYSPWIADTYIYNEQEGEDELVEGVGFGTSDCIVIGEKRGYVIDLKYGKGIVVSAENNTQAMLYALGTYNEYGMLYDFDDDYVFEIHIYQPRCNNFSVWEITVKELLEFGEKVLTKTDEALCGEAVFEPSEKACQWCAHKVNCEALISYTEETIGAMFDDIDSPKSLPVPDSVNFEKVLRAKPLITAWLSAVEKHLTEKLLDGQKVDGFKMVEGRSSRGWGDEELAIKSLRRKFKVDEVFTKKFITVPQAEKLVGKAEFTKKYDGLVHHSDGKPTLAFADDKRPDMFDCTDDFEELFE